LPARQGKAQTAYVAKDHGHDVLPFFTLRFAANSGVSLVSPVTWPEGPLRHTQGTNSANRLLKKSIHEPIEV
jgi:hypothetical protein